MKILPSFIAILVFQCVYAPTGKGNDSNKDKSGAAKRDPNYTQHDTIEKIQARGGRLLTREEVDAARAKAEEQEAREKAAAKQAAEEQEARERAARGPEPPRYSVPVERSTIEQCSIM